MIMPMAVEEVNSAEEAVHKMQAALTIRDESRRRAVLWDLAQCVQFWLSDQADRRAIELSDEDIPF